MTRPKPSKTKTTGVIDGRQVQYGTKAQLDNGHVVIQGGRARVRKQHPLDMYFHDKKIIDAEQYWSGYRLCCYYSAAYEHRSVLASLIRMPASSTALSSEDRFMAKDWYDKTMAALSRTTSHILHAILIEGQTLPEIKKVMEWQAANTGTDRFKEALNELGEAMEQLGEQLGQGASKFRLNEYLVTMRGRIR